MNVFEELDTGAGRLDILVQFMGGLTVILELKMCGFGYSSNYAASGESQLLHYMENRGSKLGYLITFDARLKKYGEELLSGSGPFTVFSKFVDMRPRIPR
jgi:PD-(D/E)XK nuclease superfamily